MSLRASDYISAVTRHRSWVGSVGLIALACAIVTVTAFAGPRRLPVTGFDDVSSDSPSVIDRDAPALRTVAADGVGLRPDGRAIMPVDPAALTALRRAHADHLRAELVLNNWNARFQNFAEPTATRLLTSRANINRVARQLAKLASAEGWNGVCVDIESMTAADGVGLVRFLQRLHSLLGRSRSLSVTIGNNTSASGFASDGYQLRALGRAAGRLILMGYDQHGPWEAAPGPIGALSWQRQGLRVLLRAVPAGKVDLGVAGYGYRWRRPPAQTVQVSDAMARSLISSPGAVARFDSVSGEWTARLPDGSVLWWSDARSYGLRARLARALHLHGLALWSLGLSDPLG